MSISPDSVFESVRRGYNELEDADNHEIISYFEDIEPDAMIGHISNIKGIVFEQEVVNALNEQDLDAMMFEATNHPFSDIALMSEGDIATEIQLKATDSTSYINETLELHSDIPIISTSEVALQIDNPLVIDSGLDNESLGQAVTDVLSGGSLIDTASEVGSDVVSEGLVEVIGESLLPIPISPIGIIAACFGIPFL